MGILPMRFEIVFVLALIYAGNCYKKRGGKSKWPKIDNCHCIDCEKNLEVGEVCDPENDKCEVSLHCHTNGQGKGICVPQCNFNPETDGCYADYVESKPNDKGVCSCEKCPERRNLPQYLARMQCRRNKDCKKNQVCKKVNDIYDGQMKVCVINKCRKIEDCLDVGHEYFDRSIRATECIPPLGAAQGRLGHCEYRNSSELRVC